MERRDETVREEEGRRERSSRRGGEDVGSNVVESSPVEVDDGVAELGGDDEESGASFVSGRGGGGTIAPSVVPLSNDENDMVGGGCIGKSPSRRGGWISSARGFQCRFP